MTRVLILAEEARVWPGVERPVGHRSCGSISRVEDDPPAEFDDTKTSHPVVLGLIPRTETPYDHRGFRGSKT